MAVNRLELHDNQRRTYSGGQTGDRYKVYSTLNTLGGLTRDLNEDFLFEFQFSDNKTEYLELPLRSGLSSILLSKRAQKAMGV